MTKKDSNILKGIAILFMLFHHLFGVKNRYAAYEFTGLIINEEFTLAIAKDLKLCVAIFAFASGYGMYKKALTENRNDISPSWFNKNCLKSYWGLIKDTCFIMIICLLITKALGLSKTPELLWEGYNYNILECIIANMTGMAGFLKIEWFISSWWYLKIAILFIMSFPILYLVLRKCGGVFLLFFSIVFVPCVLGMNVRNDNLWRYLPAFISGMVIADWRVIEKLQDLIAGKRKHKFVVALFLILLFVMSVWLKYTFSINYVIQAGQTVILALFVSVVICNISFLSDVLALLGGNSKYMWLMHVYIYGQLFNNVIFEMKNIWLIFGVLVIVTLLISIGLKRICNLIEVNMSKMYANIMNVLVKN